MLLLSTSLPYSDTKTQHHERIFTTDNNIKKNLEFQSVNLDANKNTKSSEMLIFSDANGEVLNGRYLFLVNFYGINQELEILDSKLIVGGKAFGLMGTDELRRDLIVGLLWAIFCYL